MIEHQLYVEFLFRHQYIKFFLIRMGLHEWFILKGIFKVKDFHYVYILIQTSENEAKETFYAFIVIKTASQFVVEILLYQLWSSVDGLTYYIKVKLESLCKNHNIYPSNKIDSLKLAANLWLASIYKIFHIVQNKNLAYFSHKEYWAEKIKNHHCYMLQFRSEFMSHNEIERSLGLICVILD